MSRFKKLIYRFSEFTDIKLKRRGSTTRNSTHPTPADF